MAESDLEALLNRCAVAPANDEALNRGLRQALQDHVPGLTEHTDPARALASTDATFDLVAHALPDWFITLRGGTRRGTLWSCVLREDESQDDDQAIAVGRGASPAIAMSAGLLTVLSGMEKGFR